MTTNGKLFSEDKFARISPEKKTGIVIMMNACNDEVITTTLNLLKQSYAIYDDSLENK